MKVRYDCKDWNLNLDEVNIQHHWTLKEGWAKEIDGYSGSAYVDKEGTLVIRIPFGTHEDLPNESAIRNLMNVSDSFKREVCSTSIAGYKVDEITAVDFKIGCRRVTWKEVEDLLKLRPEEE